MTGEQSADYVLRYSTGWYVVRGVPAQPVTGPFRTKADAEEAIKAARSMTLEEIKAAVEAGQTVHWSNEGYTVIKDSLGQWMILHEQGHAIGLTWRDGVTMNGEPEDFFIAGDRD